MKKNLTIDEKLETLNLMMKQDSVVIAECVCISKIIQFCTENEMMDIEAHQQEVFDIVDNIVENNTLEELGLTDLYNEIMKLYQMQLQRQQFDSFYDLINGFTEQFSNIDVDETIHKLNDTLGEFKEIENKL